MAGIRVIQVCLTGAAIALFFSVLVSGAWSLYALAQWVYGMYLVSELRPWHVLVSASVLLVVVALVLDQLEMRWGRL